MSGRNILKLKKQRRRRRLQKGRKRREKSELFFKDLL